MAAIGKPQKVKLICGMISTWLENFTRARSSLEKMFGAVDVVGDIIPFDLTHYYDEEMGHPLLRQFISFETLIDPEQLAAIKVATNRLEDGFAAEPDAAAARPINLDPGYIAPSKLILASMKDFSHRVYLRDGVYGEVTLQYRNGWQTLPWTFPDYGDGRYFDFLTAVRNQLRERQKQGDTT